MDKTEPVGTSPLPSVLTTCYVSHKISSGGTKLERTASSDSLYIPRWKGRSYCRPIFRETNSITKRAPNADDAFGLFVKLCQNRGKASPVAPRLLYISWSSICCLGLRVRQPEGYTAPQCAVGVCNEWWTIGWSAAESNHSGRLHVRPPPVPYTTLHL